MDIPSKESILFNGGAVLLILLGAGAMIKAVLVPDDVEPCSERYFQGTDLDFSRGDGTPATTGEMQSRLGTDEWGVLDNLTIEQVRGRPQSLAMRVGLSRAKDAPARRDGQRGGVGFKWQPGFPGAQRSACLAYKLWIPSDFNFSRGGVLPGLHGGSLSNDAEVSDEFSVRFRWARDGKGGIRTHKAGTKPDRGPRNDGDVFELPKGKWVSLEQEVTLNTPGAENGILRVWVDGEMVVSESGKKFRTKRGSQILGVDAQTQYRRVRGHHRVEKAQSVLITPFELRWQ